MQKTKTEQIWAEAGRKSWVTRRENEMKARRSAAAKKAAATRKANREARMKEEVKAAKAKASSTAKSTKTRAKATVSKTKTRVKTAASNVKTLKAKKTAKKTEALPLTKNQILKQKRSAAAKKSWATRKKNAKQN